MKQITTPEDKIELSIIVVSYNTADLTLACLESVFAHTHRHPFELIVIDNASSDGSAELIASRFPQIQLLPSRKNHGFAAANNIAAKHARGEWLLLLNPDTVIKDNAIDRLVKFAKSCEDAHIFGGRTLFGDGTLNPTSCWARPTLWSTFCIAAGLASTFRGNKFFDSEAIGGWRRDSIREVDIVTGCFFLIRKRDWEKLGGFDARFFMYGEEADLCLRAARSNLKCMICPHAEIIHYGGASERDRADKFIKLFRAKSQLFAAHWSRPEARLGALTLDLWALTRLCAFSVCQLLSNSYRERRDTWRRIWQERRSWHTPLHSEHENADM